MKTTVSSTGRNRISLILPLFLFAGALIFAVFFFSSSPARAAIFATLTPTQESLFAVANIAKPTYTATPLPTNTPIVTETPGVMAMQVVEDTVVPVATKASSYAQNVSLAEASGAKYILVDISEQHMYVYQGNSLIYSFVASTGMNNATRVGTFAVQSKIPNAYGSTWNIWMPNWLGIYWSGGLENGIHALPILPNGATLWAGFLGRPISYGCVVLGSYEASVLYDWAEMGTTVEIRW
jgi:lipoprotein-anchoring transpeptidase ErfK/SrfK